MIIKQALVFLNGEFTKTDVRVENGVIAEVGTLEAVGDVADGEGKLLLPGLLEIHSHGCVGEDFSTSDEKGVEKMRRYYLEKRHHLGTCHHHDGRTRPPAPRDGND